MEDQEIVELYWARSEQAIEESEGKYGAFCRTIARNILSQEEDAEECVNDTWLRAWNTMPPQRPRLLSAFFWKNHPEPVSGPLAARPGGQAGRGPGGDGPGGAGALSPRPGAAGGTAGGAGDRRPHLPVSPGAARSIRISILRRYWYLDSIAGLAGRFQLSESQVKSRLHRTRQRLKEALLREGVAV